MAGSDKVLNSLFQAITFGLLRFAPTGQPDSQAATLADLMAGVVPSVKTVSGISAYQAGGKANATLLTGVLNSVDTAGANAASVSLPTTSNNGVSLAGLEIIIANTTAYSIAVFPFEGTGTINGGAAGASVSQAAGTHATYWVTAIGKWIRIQSS